MPNPIQAAREKFLQTKDKFQNVERSTVGNHRVKVKKANIDGELRPVKVKIKDVNTGEKQVKAKFDEGKNQFLINLYSQQDKDNIVSVQLNAATHILPTPEQVIELYELQKHRLHKETQVPYNFVNVERIVDESHQNRRNVEASAGVVKAQNNFMEAVHRIAGKNIRNWGTVPQVSASAEIQSEPATSTPPQASTSERQSTGTVANISAGNAVSVLELSSGSPLLDKALAAYPEQLGEQRSPIAGVTNNPIEAPALYYGQSEIQPAAPATAGNPSARGATDAIPLPPENTDATSASSTPFETAESCGDDISLPPPPVAAAVSAAQPTPGSLSNTPSASTQLPTIPEEGEIASLSFSFIAGSSNKSTPRLASEQHPT